MCRNEGGLQLLGAGEMRMVCGLNFVPESSVQPTPSRNSISETFYIADKGAQT